MAFLDDIGVTKLISLISGKVPIGSVTEPKMDGMAAVGTETAFARGDHVHPKDMSKADKSRTVTNVSFNTSSSKIQKTINGSTTDVVGVASQSSAGLMSASDKTKLDGIDTGSGSNTTYHFTIIDNGGSYYLHCEDSVPVSPGAFVTLHMGDPEYFNAVCMSDPNDSLVQGYFDCRIWNFSGIHVIPIQGDDGNDHYISRIIFARISVDDTGNTVTQSLYVDYDIENNVGDDWADLEANVNW